MSHPRQQQPPLRANKPDDRKQSKALIEKAREIGADEAADDLIGRLAKTPPEPRRSPARRGGGKSLYWGSADRAGWPGNYKCAREEKMEFCR